MNLMFPVHWGGFYVSAGTGGVSFGLGISSITVIGAVSGGLIFRNWALHVFSIFILLLYLITNPRIMKNKFATGLLLTSAILMMVSCNTKKEETSTVVIDKEQIKQEIQAKENLFAETYNAGEKKNIGYYADDAISFAQNRAPLIGKEAIVEYLLEGLDNKDNSNKISFTTNEVFVSNDGIQVVEIGFYKVVDSTNTIINSGNYMSLFEKRDGNYVSVRDMSVSNMPIEIPNVEE